MNNNPIIIPKNSLNSKDLERWNNAKQSILQFYDKPESDLVKILSRLNNLIKLLEAKDEGTSLLYQRRTSSETERIRVLNRLNGFGFQNSPAWSIITSRWGDNLSQTELLGIATILSFKTGLKVDREAKRRKDVLVKWFDENLPILKHYLELVVLEDDQGHRFPQINSSESKIY